jgi:hypothetical protein
VVAMHGRQRYAATLAGLAMGEGAFVFAFMLLVGPVWGGLERTLGWNLAEPHAQVVIVAILGACLLLVSWGVASREWSSQISSAYWIPPMLVHVGFLLCLPGVNTVAAVALPFVASCGVSPLSGYAGYRLGRRIAAASGANGTRRGSVE